MKATKLFTEFFHSEKSAGLVLIGCTFISLLLANSSFGHVYLDAWHSTFITRSVEFWINDGLMTVFFLLVGLEIEREIYVGEFSDLRKAMLPIMAAIGGMLIPALIHFGFNFGTPYQTGFGIPMATDIAFSLGILSLLGNRVPMMLKVFLTALAIIDDLGAIIIIALFYAEAISWLYLGLAVLLFSTMLIFNRAKVNALWLYLVPGIGLWYFLYQSGIHPTITGVLLAFAIPFRDGGESSPSYRLQHFLHKPVAFIVLPLFALANTAILFPASGFQTLLNTNTYGVLTGLVVGKPIGIFLFAMAGILAGFCVLPQGIKKRHIIGVGLLAGIGFTMSIFIALLAFTDQETINSTKIAILVASLLAGILGVIWLRVTLPFKAEAIE